MDFDKNRLDNEIGAMTDQARWKIPPEHYDEINRLAEKLTEDEPEMECLRGKLNVLEAMRDMTKTIYWQQIHSAVPNAPTDVPLAIDRDTMEIYKRSTSIHSSIISKLFKNLGLDLGSQL